MDRDDIGQEIELQKALGNYKYAMKRVYSIQRSVAWSNSYKGKFSHVSIEEIYYNDRGQAVVIADQLVDKSNWSSLVDVKCDLTFFMSVLSLEERSMVLLYYIDGYTYAEIGCLYRMNRKTVSKIIRGAIEKVKEFCNSLKLSTTKVVEAK